MLAIVAVQVTSCGKQFTPPKSSNLKCVENISAIATKCDMRTNNIKVKKNEAECTVLT